jgi:hypothetical protein
MTRFTPTQGRYLSFIHAYTATIGQPPSMQEIATAMGVSSPSVNGMLKSLAEKGLIRREAGASRAIELLVDSAELPRWKKKIKADFRFWAPKEATREQIDQIIGRIIANRKQNRAASAAMRPKVTKQPVSLADSQVYRFKISLNGFQPQIWRQIETLDVELSEFHEILLHAMGWGGHHLHQFTIDDEDYGNSELCDSDPGTVQNYEGLRISELVETHGEKFAMTWLYDFGDGWEHKVALQKITPLCGDTNAYPRCIGGAHACPPDDVGGVWGFSDFLQSINDPTDSEHEMYREWAGEYDFDAFDAELTSQRMKPMVSRPPRKRRTRK